MRRARRSGATRHAGVEGVRSRDLAQRGVFGAQLPHERGVHGIVSGREGRVLVEDGQDGVVHGDGAADGAAVDGLEAGAVEVVQ